MFDSEKLEKQRLVIKDFNLVRVSIAYKKY